MSVRRAVLRLALSVGGAGGFAVDDRGHPRRGSAPRIFVCNHAALIDTVYAILAISEDFTVCGAKPRFFSSFLRRRLMAFLRIIEVRSHEQFLRDCRRLLDEGRSLLIYPEMGRNPAGMGRFETWAAEVALDSGATIVPCYLHGTTDGQTGAVRMVIGEHFTAAPSHDATSLTALLFERVRSLAP